MHLRKEKKKENAINKVTDENRHGEMIPKQEGKGKGWGWGEGRWTEMKAMRMEFKVQLVYPGFAPHRNSLMTLPQRQ